MTLETGRCGAATKNGFERVQRALAVLLVVLAGFLAYGPVLDSDFLNLDDQEFIVENPLIPGGLTLRSVKWALTADVSADSEYVDYWQPATLISRLIDGSLFGLNPAGHHLTSLLIHLVNAVLLLLLLAAATGRLWRSAVVALVFATHPLHVSSVAWATERKDVLSVLFSLISLAIFARFAAVYREHLDRRSGERTGGRVILWYLLLAAGYALCLMSKPMTLPLPLVMLLVAVWPIPRERRPGLLRLALALVPLLVLSAGALFLYSQGGVAHSEIERIGIQSPFSAAALIVTSFAAYPARLLSPANLQHIYAVHPGSAPTWQVAGSLLLLAAATLVSAAGARRRPYLAVGWLWYLVSLLPVAALLQSEAAADRFSYFPVIGVTVMIVWGIGDFAVGRWVAIRAFAVTVAVVALVLTTRAECRYWQNSLKLFSHLVELDPRHNLARRQLAIALATAGEPAKALAQFQVVLAARPDFSLNYYNIGVVLEQLGRVDEALDYYATAARLAPRDTTALYNMGMIHINRGKLDDGLACFLEAISRNPRSAGALQKVGSIKELQGQFDSASEYYQRALEIEPGNPLFLKDLAAAMGDLQNLRSRREDGSNPKRKP